jgi:galactose mutarotase-like enzyme
MSEARFKAAQKENVLIRTGNCAVTTLPYLACKISSIQAKGREILQSTPAAHDPRTRTMSFDADYASGWSENWCALERPQADLRIKVSSDPAATPYLGLWICQGGWPARPGPRQASVAYEPSTAPVDSLAKSGSWSRVLSPGESCYRTMVVEIDSN